MQKNNRPTSKRYSKLNRIGVINTVLLSFVVLVIACSIIASAVAKNDLRNFELDGAANSAELPAPFEDKGTVTDILQLAYVYGEAGLTDMKNELLEELFSIDGSRKEILNYFKKLLTTNIADIRSASKFIELSTLVSDYFTAEEIVSDVMLRHFDQKYTSTFYYTYEMLLPTVDRDVIDVLLEKAEKTDLYHAYLMHSAIRDAKSRAWCDAHDIVNTEIVSSSDGETVYHIKHYYDKNGLLTDTSEERDDGVTYTLFEYNEFGKLDTEMIHSTNNYSSDSYLKSKVNYFYTPNGSLTKKQIEEYDSDENISSVTTISYDADGRITSEVITANGTSNTTVYLYVFDSEGRLAEETHLLEGNIIYRLGYSYNNPDFPDKPSEVQNYINGILYQYVYDRSGRIEYLREWISGQVDKETRYVYNILGELRRVTESTGKRVWSETVYNYQCLESSEKEEQK